MNDSRQVQAGLDKDVLFALQYALGRKHAIGRAALLGYLHSVYGREVNEREMRQCIHDLRRAGHLICSAPGEDGGYYMATTLQEFDEFLERELHPKAMDLLETEKAMKAAARQRFGEAAQIGLM